MIKLGHTVGNLDVFGIFGGGMLTIVSLSICVSKSSKNSKIMQNQLREHAKIFSKSQIDYLLVQWWIIIQSKCLDQSNENSPINESNLISIL
jgi:hypothetical protein